MLFYDFMPCKTHDHVKSEKLKCNEFIPGKAEKCIYRTQSNQNLKCDIIDNLQKVNGHCKRSKLLNGRNLCKWLLNLLDKMVDARLAYFRILSK